MKFAIIPARGGSKRIPRKNIKIFNGSPMLSWPVRVAINSGVFDRVIVTTDDEEIASVARAFGAEVPFIRPAELADDYATTIDVVSHALNELSVAATDQVCCIYPTAVFTTETLLLEAAELLDNTYADFVMPVAAYTSPLDRALTIDAKNSLHAAKPEFAVIRTQDCQAYYFDVGQFYFGQAASWLSDKPFYSQDVRAIVTPKHWAVDIDTLEDWHLAEMLFVHSRNHA